MAPGLAKRLPGWTSNRGRLVTGRSAPNEGECFNGRSPKARLVRADAAFGKTFVAIRFGWTDFDLFGADASRPEIAWLNSGLLWSSPNHSILDLRDDR